MKKLRPMVHRSALYWHRNSLRKPLAFTEEGQTSFNWTEKGRQQRLPFGNARWKEKAEKSLTMDGLIVKDGV